MTFSLSKYASSQPVRNRRKFLKQLMVFPASMSLGVIGLEAASAQSGVADSVKALTFDVFGTVVDWRSSIIRGYSKN